MAGITRETHIVFGSTGPYASYGEFGSKAAGSATTPNPRSIATTQALPAWVAGWQDAILTGNYAPYLEDLNAYCWEHSYQVGYLLTRGVPCWDAGTTYNIGDVTREVAGSNLYISLVDSNTNHALPSAPNSNTQWAAISYAPGVVVSHHRDDAGPQRGQQQQRPAAESSQ